MMTLVVLGTALMILFGSLAAADAAKPAGKIRACVAKSGPTQGLVRYSKSGKCKRGERKVAWNKKGKTGPAGETGPAGKDGQPGSAGDLDELQTLVDQQAATITQLTQQLDSLTSEVDGLSPQVDALCTQVSSVTDQSDLLGEGLDGLNALIDPLTLGLLPTVPPALGSFDCP